MFRVRDPQLVTSIRQDEGLEAVTAVPVRVDRLLRSVEPTTVAVALAVVLAVTGAAGAAQALQGPVEAEGAPAPGGVLGLFYLDGEYNVAAAVSTGLWLVAALSMYAAGRVIEAGHGRFVWTGLAVALVYFGVDEGLKLHERVEGETGIDWQLLFAPLLIATALAGLYVIVRAGPGTPQLLLLAAGGAAVTAQLLEAAQWNGGEPVGPYRALMVPEEILELTATALIAVAALTLLQETPS
jgi:hypothetical protein